MGTGSIYIGLKERDVLAAMTSRRACASLVARLAARTEQGSLLAFLGRLATEPVAWLDGDLAVELFEEEQATKLRVLAELGGGQREGVLPPVVVNAPIDELATLAERAAEVLGPLRMERVSSRSLMFVTSADEIAMPAFDLSETCLSNRLDAVEVDEGWDVN
jgi:hypothetical protein